MKKNIITISKLLKLIENGKAPKEIKYQEYTCQYDFTEDYYCSDYINNSNYNHLILYLFATKFITEALNTEIEIIPEENDEWEDIYTLGDIEEGHFMNRQNGMTQEDRRLLDSNFKALGETINQLIKNQRKIIEKLESKNEK